jgi:hypothetical protein
MLLAFETGVPTLFCSNKPPLMRENSEESIKVLSEE